MRKTLLLLALVIMCSSVVKGQESLAQATGPLVPGYKVPSCNNFIVNDSEEEFTVYCSPKAVNSKGAIHQFVTYNKNTQSISKQEVVLPNDHFTNAVIDAGKHYVVSYCRYPKGNIYEYVTAEIPKKPGVTTVNPVVRLSLDVDRRGYSYEYSAKSKDGKYTAVLLFVTDRKANANVFHLFLYDETGEEVMYHRLAPKIYGNTFSLEDLAVGNDGVVALLLHTGNQKNDLFVDDAIQIITCKGNETKSLGKKMEAGIIYSMKLCMLSNGDYFVGGYYALKAKEPTYGWFNAIVDGDTQEFGKIHAEALTSAQAAPWCEQLIFTKLGYHTDCSFLQEMPDGSIYMIGEHRCNTVIYNQGSATFWNYTNSIVYQNFNKYGELQFSNVIKKSQKSGGKFTAGDNGVSTYKYHDIGLSFSTFVDGSDVYVLYNDTQNNYRENTGAATLNAELGRGKSCVIMAQLTADGPDRSLVLVPDKAKRILHKVWHFDGKTVYFSTFNKKELKLESFQPTD